jgi:transcriptional regulator with XRE-family HTH domain
MKVTFDTPLQELRSRKGVTLLELAEASEISESHLSRIERGVHAASPRVAARIASFFKNQITRDQILFPGEPAAPRAVSVPRPARLKKAS